MYHYVRELAHSPYPRIKGRTVEAFEEQLEYIAKHYTFITIAQLLSSLSDPDSSLPSNAVVLTFDDGYLDHYTNVFPILESKGIQGFFFPVSASTTGGQVLDVNKIHFVLASMPDPDVLAAEVFELIDECRSNYALDSNDYYFRTHARESRLDTANVILLKRLLQTVLPTEARARISDQLFRRHVTDDESSFAKGLYMDLDHLRHMRSKGMYVGSHSHSHGWMDSMSQEIQTSEIESSLVLQQDLRCAPQQWGFAYPYGAYNDTLLSLLSEKGCKFGLTTRVGIADLDDSGMYAHLLLPRLDTNDLPTNRDATPNKFTVQILETGVSTN